MINKNSKYNVVVVITHGTLNVGYMHEHMCLYHLLAMYIYNATELKDAAVAMYTMLYSLNMQIIPCK